MSTGWSWLSERGWGWRRETREMRGQLDNERTVVKSDETHTNKHKLNTKYDYNASLEKSTIYYIVIINIREMKKETSSASHCARSKWHIRALSPEYSTRRVVVRYISLMMSKHAKWKIRISDWPPDLLILLCNTIHNTSDDLMSQIWQTHQGSMKLSWPADRTWFLVRHYGWIGW
jgi:hypothetical protein